MFRISSDVGTYLNHLAKLFQSFQQRGYPPRLLQAWTKDLLYSNRDARIYKRKMRPFRVQAEDTFFRSTHHRGYSTSSIKKALHTELLPFRNRVVTLPDTSLTKHLVRAKALQPQQPHPSTEEEPTTHDQ